jgi:hypothetical protein
LSRRQEHIDLAVGLIVRKDAQQTNLKVVRISLTHLAASSLKVGSQLRHSRGVVDVPVQKSLSPSLGAKKYP